MCTNFIPSKTIKGCAYNIEIDMNEIKFLNALCIGENVETYLIYRDSTLRIAKRSKINSNGLVCPRFLREINILKKLNNPPENLINHIGRQHIIKLLDVYTSNNYLYFELEYADGCLSDYLRNNKKVNMIYDKILIDISNGLQYIHALNIVHRDLNFNNIVYFLNNENTSIIDKYVIIDFGNAICNDHIYTTELSTYYIIPDESIYFFNELSKIQYYIDTIKNYDELKLKINEINKNINTLYYGKKYDIWSLGALAYLLVTKKMYINEMMKKKYTYYQNTSNESIIKYDNNQFTKKAELMLSNVIIRPLIYFTNIISYTEEIELNEIAKCDQLEFMNLLNDILETINNLMKNNKIKMNIIVILDEKDIFIKDFIKYYHNIKMKFKKDINNTNIEYIYGILLLWILTHLYTNNVWNIIDIVEIISNRIGETISNEYIINLSFQIFLLL